MNLTLAACRGWDPELWFATDHQHAERATALAICQGCPIRQTCLERAMAFEAQVGNFNRQGIVGGLTALERGRLAKGVQPKPRAVEQHGSPAGYRQHERARTKTCQDCKDAMAAVRKAERERKRAA